MQRKRWEITDIFRIYLDYVNHFMLSNSQTKVAESGPCLLEYLHCHLSILCLPMNSSIASDNIIQVFSCNQLVLPTKITQTE